MTEVKCSLKLSNQGSNIYHLETIVHVYRLIEFMILVVYRSLIDGGSSHETTPWPGPGFSAERM